MKSISKIVGCTPIYAALIAGSVPLYFFIKYPVSIPFADDWVLMPWILPGTDPNIENYFSGVNGHQQVIIKLFLQFYEMIFSYDLYAVGFIGILMTIMCAILFGYDLYRFSTKKINFLILVSVGLVIVNLRQFQNYFMIISIPWIFSLTCIFLFSFFFLRKDNFNSICYRLPLFLSPFCNGMGTSFVLAVFIVGIVELLFQKTKVKFLSSADIVTVCLSLILSELLPKFVLNESSSLSDQILNGSTYLYQNPIKGIEFFFLLIGQIIVSGWSSVALISGICIGIFLFIVFLFLIRSVEYSRFVLVGIIFSLTFFIFSITIILTRLPVMDVIGASEPRYSTASLIFICSLVIFLFNSKLNYNINYNNLIIYFALFALFAGNSIGVAYLKDRNFSENKIRACIKIEDVKNCKQLYLPLVMVDSKAYFDKFVPKILE